MQKSTGRTSNAHTDQNDRASDRNVSTNPSGRAIRSSVVVVAPRSGAPDIGSSTLKQNAALMDRLRRVAMRSDPPPPPLVPTIAPRRAIRTEDMGRAPEESTELKSGDFQVIDAQKAEPSARPFMLVRPSLAPLSALDVAKAMRAPSLLPPAPPAVIAGVDESEPVTNMSPALRRAKDASPAPKSRRTAPVIAAVLVVVAAAIAGTAVREKAGLRSPSASPGASEMTKKVGTP